MRGIEKEEKYSTVIGAMKALVSTKRLDIEAARGVNEEVYVTQVILL